MKAIHILLIPVLFACPCGEQVMGQSVEPPDVSTARFRNLSRQLHAQGLPEVEKAVWEKSILVVRLLTPPDNDTSLQEPRQLLPALLLAYGLVRDAGLSASALRVACPLPDGDRLEAEATVDRLGDFVGKRSTLEDFVSQAKLTRVAWRPPDGTKDEITTAFWEHGKKLFEKKQITQALTAFREVEKRNPRFPKLAQALALVLFRASQFSEAVPWLEAAFKENPADASLPKIGVALSNELFQAGQLEKAIRVTNLFDVDPTDINLKTMRLIRAMAEVKGGDAAKGEQTAEEATRLMPESWEPWFWLADACAQQNKWPRAIEYATKALERNPAHAASLFVLGLAQTATEQYKPAVESLGKAWELMQKEGVTPSENLFVQLSYAYAKLNDAAQVVKAAEAGLACYPQSASLQTNYKAGYKAMLARKK